MRVAVQENPGVSAALDRCLSEARAAEFALVLNNDVELTPGFVDPLVATLDAHPEPAQPVERCSTHLIARHWTAPATSCVGRRVLTTWTRRA